MTTPTQNSGRQNFLPLRDAILCMDCHFISDDTRNVCFVCGGHSLSQLQELVNKITGSSASFVEGGAFEYLGVGLTAERAQQR